MVTLTTSARDAAHSVMKPSQRIHPSSLKVLPHNATSSRPTAEASPQAGKCFYFGSGVQGYTAKDWLHHTASPTGAVPCLYQKGLKLTTRHGLVIITHQIEQQSCLIENTMKNCPGVYLFICDKLNIKRQVSKHGMVPITIPLRPTADVALTPNQSTAKQTSQHKKQSHVHHVTQRPHPCPSQAQQQLRAARSGNTGHRRASVTRAQQPQQQHLGAHMDQITAPG